jgi:FKBP-type peptidyl-prolyl cis-trans isomerase SlyD
MQITKNKVATFDYTLKNDQGEVLDSSDGGHPLAYLHGVGSLIPGLEKALEGRSPGDSLQVSIPPKDAYGLRDESLRQQVSLSQFDSVDNLQIGMQFLLPSEDGDRVVRVEEIQGNKVTIDGNHQLAGMTLHFDVTIREVRDATKAEKAHGHVHGPGGHHH